MNEPIISKGFRPKSGKKAASSKGHSDRNSEPADEQVFEKDSKTPSKGLRHNQTSTQTQDKNVKVVNDKDANTPEFDQALPPDYRAKVTPPVEPGKTEDESRLE